MTHIELIDDLIENNVTMVDHDRFHTILRNSENIQKIKGDVVECGVWRGGMSIFLSSLFFDKNIWVCDSFDGFQSLDTATYEYHDEPHTPSYSNSIQVRYDDVVQNFKNYGFDAPDSRINFLEGWVKDTLNPITCKIQSISLLRIYVDAYSATREVLDYLYPKVKKGGIISGDDYGWEGVHKSLSKFSNENSIPHTVLQNKVHWLINK